MNRRRDAAPPARRLVLVLVACLLAACTAPPEPVDAVVPPVAPSLTPSPTSAPEPVPEPEPPATSVLTGTGLPDGPVLAAKVENTRQATPRVGVDEADVVWTVPVEGGLTRLLAVWSTRMPAEVGPVRSARASDVDLLGNLGPVAFAFSGASGATRAALRDGGQVDVDQDGGPQGFRRDPDRRAPHDVMGQTGELLARAGGSVLPGDAGFRFGPAPAGGLPTGVVSTAWPSSGQAFTWSPQEARWLLTTDGSEDVAASGTRLGPQTVVVQRVATGLSANRDVNGARTPTVELVGSGEAVVLRDGARFDGTWTRPDLASPTTFLTATGEPATFAAGQVWVLLVPQGQAVDVG